MSYIYGLTKKSASTFVKTAKKQGCALGLLTVGIGGLLTFPLFLIETLALPMEILIDKYSRK